MIHENVIKNKYDMEQTSIENIIYKRNTNKIVNIINDLITI